MKEIRLEAVISLRGNDSQIRVQGSPTAQRFCVFIALENLHRERFPGRHVGTILPAIRSADLPTPGGRGGTVLELRRTVCFTKMWVQRFD